MTVITKSELISDIDVKIDIANDFMSEIFEKWIKLIDFNRIQAGISRKQVFLNTGISVKALERGFAQNYGFYTLERFFLIVEFLEKNSGYTPPFPGLTYKMLFIWVSDLDRRREANKVTAVQIAKNIGVDNTAMRYWKERNYLCIKVDKFIELLQYLEKVGVDTRVYR